MNVRRTRAGKVAVLGEVNALLVTHRADEFGNEKAGVRPALPVRVRDEIHWNTIDARGEIGAVVEIEAAQIILVGFALAAVLRDDQARHRLQNLARTNDGPQLDLFLPDVARRRRVRDAHLRIAPARDNDLSQLDRRVGEHGFGWRCIREGLAGSGLASGQDRPHSAGDGEGEVSGRTRKWILTRLFLHNNNLPVIHSD